MRDYYKVLGVDKMASEQEVRKAYRRLALQYHPDRNKDNSATQQFNEATEAFQVLSDPQKRTKYDLFGGELYSIGVVDLEGRVGLTKEQMKIMDKEKLSRFKEDYQRLQSVSKIFSAAMGISAGMVGSYAIYEQFKDAGNVGYIWLFFSFVIGYSGFSGKIETGRALKEKKRDIEILTKDIEHYYGSIFNKNESL